MAGAKEKCDRLFQETIFPVLRMFIPFSKKVFKNILQELMEAELDTSLGYEKNQKGNITTDNKRNRHSSKNLKSQYRKFEVAVPKDRNEEFEQKLIPKYQRDISGKKKVIPHELNGEICRLEKVNSSAGLNSTNV